MKPAPLKTLFSYLFSDRKKNTSKTHFLGETQNAFCTKEIPEIKALEN